MTAIGSRPTLDEEDPSISGTAYGPADIRDTPHVKQSLAIDEDDTPDPWIGRRLANVYEIEAKIGEGGMGSVYLARHIHLQKAFAIKVLVDTITTKSNAVDRLRQEALATAKIDHENIVEVMNFDRTDDGAVFIVMELLKGEPLDVAISRGPIELHRALPIAYQICRALQAAHDHQIVHRDLKPENVFLTDKRGRTIVKVLDFGISKIKSADAEQVKMTRTGQLVGTPLYMSPEQARGESEVDRRVDVYALGVILFEMLTGTPPFEGRNYFELLWKHGNEEPPTPRETNPNQHIPEAVEAVVLKALAKDRDARFQSMKELEEALIAAAPEVPTLSAMPSLPPARPSAPVGATAEIGTARTEVDVARSEAPPPMEAEEAGPPPARGPMIAVVGAAVLAIGVGVFVALGGDGADPRETAPAPSPAPAPVAEPESVPAPEPAPAPPVGVDPPPAPSAIEVALDSSPSGATVRAGGETLGVTPFTAELAPSETPVELEFSLAGHRSRTIEVTPHEGVTVDSVRLHRPRSRDQAPESGASSAIKGSL